MEKVELSAEGRYRVPLNTVDGEMLPVCWM